MDVNEYLDVDDDNDEMQCQEINFQGRSSVDTKFDDYGKKILNVCSTNDLYAMNGREGSVCNIGRATCKDSKSIIDYVIVSPEILCDNTEFNILDFDCLFSDIHCAIKTQISLCINYSENDENTPIKTHSEGVECLASHTKKVQWVDNKANEFVQSFDLSDVDSALQSLQEGGSNVNNCC